MITRRLLLAAALAAPILPARAGAPHLTDDGPFTQDWFLQSLLELGDDLALAGSNGKRLALMWELKGCPYCRETHVKNFGDPAITAFIRAHFEVVQLNVIGARIVTDFDGAKLSEKAMAEKYGVRFTPTFLFFPESVDAMAGKKPREREVARAQGYLEPRHFLALFRFVADKAYETTTLRDYLRAQGA
jgi:thioredoxin-related protein